MFFHVFVWLCFLFSLFSLLSYIKSCNSIKKLILPPNGMRSTSLLVKIHNNHPIPKILFTCKTLSSSQAENYTRSRCEVSWSNRSWHLSWIENLVASHLKGNIHNQFRRTRVNCCTIFSWSDQLTYTEIGFGNIINFILEIIRMDWLYIYQWVIFGGDLLRKGVL